MTRPDLGEDTPPTLDPTAATRDVRRESLAYLPGKLVRAFMGALTIPILASLPFITPGDVGRYDLTIRFVDFLYTLCALWLGTVIVRFYSIYRQRGQLALYTDVVSKIQLAGILIGLCLLFLARWLGPEGLFGSYRALLDVAGPMFIGYTLFESGLMMLRAKSKAFTFSLSSAASALGRIVVGLCLALKLGISGMLWGTAIVNIFVYFYVMRSHFSRVRFSLTPDEKQLLREVLIYGLPLCLSSSLAFLLGNSDRYLLKYILGPVRGDGEVGQFVVGGLFGEQPLFVIYSTLMLAVFPAASRLYDHHGRKATEAFNRSETRVYLLIAFPVLILLAVFAEPFLRVFPAKYAASHQVMPWVAGGAFLIGLSQYPAQGLLITKRTRWIFVVNIAAVFLNLAVNWFLIPIHGFVACGIARVVANGFLVVVMAAITTRSLTWRVSPLAVLRIGLAGVLMGLGAYGACRYLPAQTPRVLDLAFLTVASAVSLAVFVCLLLLSGELRIRDLRSGLRAILG